MFNTCRDRQKRKFTRLENKCKSAKVVDPVITNVSSEEAAELRSKWVKNISSHSLTPTEQSLLCKGANVAIVPSEVPKHEYVIGIEQACKFIGPSTAEAARLQSACVSLLKRATLPPSNISDDEREALKTLSKDKTITILPADKGRMMVVMDTEEYKRKAKELLSDTNTYKVLKKDPTAVYLKQLNKTIDDLWFDKSITNDVKLKLKPTSTLTPRFYGLPKGAQKRQSPITYKLARYVADVLKPLMGKNGYALKNSADLVDSMKDFVLPEGTVLVSSDVKALFTNVPVARSLKIILDRLENDPLLAERTTLSPVQVRDLLKICLTTTYFQFDGVIYIQVEGAAMGSPVSPIVANLFMEWFEEHALATFRAELQLWKRYVDDTGVALEETLMEEFTTHINSIHPDIQFTREEENEEKCLPMLDVKTQRGDEGRLSFTVYRKPTHTDQYLQFDSNQPLQHKLGVIRTLHHRAQTLCSTEEAKMNEIEHLQRVLSISGYTKSAWVTNTKPKPKAPTV